VLGERRRQFERPAGADGGGNRLLDQFVERSRAHDPQHLDQIRWSRADVAKEEFVLLCGGHRSAFTSRFLEERLVGRGIHELFQLFLVRYLDLEHPPAVVGIFVHVLGES